MGLGENIRRPCPFMYERRLLYAHLFIVKKTDISFSSLQPALNRRQNKIPTYLSFFVLCKNVTFSIRVLYCIVSLILPCSILFLLFLTVVFLVRVNSPKGQRKNSLILLFHPTSFVFFFEDEGNDVMLGYVIMYATFVELML